MVKGCIAWEGARGNVDGILMGGREMKQRLWVIGLGLWGFGTIDGK